MLFVLKHKYIYWEWIARSSNLINLKEVRYNWKLCKCIDGAQEMTPKKHLFVFILKSYDSSNTFLFFKVFHSHFSFHSPYNNCPVNLNYTLNDCGWQNSRMTLSGAHSYIILSTVCLWNVWICWTITLMIISPYMAKGILKMD